MTDPIRSAADILAPVARRLAPGETIGIGEQWADHVNPDDPSRVFLALSFAREQAETGFGMSEEALAELRESTARSQAFADWCERDRRERSITARLGRLFRRLRRA